MRENTHVTILRHILHILSEGAQQIEPHLPTVVNQLIKTILLAFLSSLFIPHFHTVLSGIISQINYLYPNLDLSLGFWRNTN